MRKTVSSPSVKISPLLIILTIYSTWPLRYLTIPKHLIFSFPKMGSILLSGVNHCLFSGSCSSFFFRYAHRCFTICGLLISSSSGRSSSPDSSLESLRGFMSPVAFFLAGEESEPDPADLPSSSLPLSAATDFFLGGITIVHKSFCADRELDGKKIT